MEKIQEQNEVENLLYEMGFDKVLIQQVKQLTNNPEHAIDLAIKLNDPTYQQEFANNQNRQIVVH